MDLNERKVFWETLCSLPGNDPQAEQEQLLKTIRYPKYLFRYRPVTMKSLEALRTNKLYFSSANYYDDPFDTFLFIDIERIKNEYLNRDEDKLASVLERVKPILSLTMTPDKVAEFTVEKVQETLSPEWMSKFLSSTLALRDQLKKDAWSVCFSENGFNEALWLKYADQHKGFALIYDLENVDNLLCGQYDKCANCGIRQYGTPLYPIYYSDKPYDATNFAMLIVLRMLEENVRLPLGQMLHFSLGTGIWEMERTTLIKKKCHEYDEEWRLIIGCPMKPPIMREWRPSGIILGLRMDVAEENLVVSMAQEAGIKNIYKSFINEKNELDGKPIML